MMCEITNYRLNIVNILKENLFLPAVYMDRSVKSCACKTNKNINVIIPLRLNVRSPELIRMISFYDLAILSQSCPK